jgi:hypothetical protein
MSISGNANNVTTIIVDSTIGGHMLRSVEGGVYGGSVFLTHNGPVSSVAVVVRRSLMQGNSLTAAGVKNQGGGGGLHMEMFAKATSVSTTIEDSTISDNTLLRPAGGGGGEGGAVYLWCGGVSAGDVTMTFRNSTFKNNHADGRGGAASILMPTSSPFTGFIRTVFIDCHFLRNSAGLDRGAIWHSMQHVGASISLHRCVLHDNYADRCGGGIHAAQTTNNPATNLEMLVTFNGPTSFPRYTCSAVYTGADGYAREWDYGSSVLFISDSTISGNRAGTDEAAGGTDAVASGGGGTHAKDVNVTVLACEIAGNQVVGGAGGAFYLDGGSAQLSVEGNTSITGNSATEDGAAIYSISGGGITLGDTTAIDFIRDEAAAGITILSGGKLEHGANTLMRCSAGERMLYNLTTAPTSFNSWRIDCGQVRSIDNGSQIIFVHPTCEQIQDGISPLYTFVCVLICRCYRLCCRHRAQSLAYHVPATSTASTVAAISRAANLCATSGALNALTAERVYKEVHGFR